MTAFKKKTKRSEMVKKTEFSLSAPQAQRISIAGISINGSGEKVALPGTDHPAPRETF